MANKKPKDQKPVKSSDRQAQRRIRTLQIVFGVFCVLLILSMVLQLIAK